MKRAALTDQELIEKTRTGDNAAFGELWARHERAVAALCRRYLCCASADPAVDEQDLAADTFIRALHGLDRYQDRSGEGIPFHAWLLQIAKHVCLTFLQRPRSRAVCVALEEAELADRGEGSPSVGQVVQERELLRLAAQEINALPATYRAPFKLFLEEYSQKEISTVLGISLAAARKRVERARDLLQPRLAPLLDLGTAEQALTEIVSDHRIVSIRLPSGGEVQLCLRVDRQFGSREREIAARRAWLRSQPRAWRKRLELAEICYHSGRWEEARELYREIVGIHPGCLPATLRLGRMLRHESKVAEAAHIYRTALSHQTEATERLRAELAATESRDEEAVEAFRCAIALAPGDTDGYYGLFHALGRLSRYEEQLTTLSRIREIDPNDVRAHVAAYTPCARLCRFDLARPLLERAVALDPNDLTAVKHLFQVRMNLRLLDEETQGLAQRLVELAPRLVDSWEQLAWFYAELERDEESLAVLHQFLAEHPDNAQAHAALAWRYGYLGDVASAVRHARRAYALEPHDSHICWTMLVACSHRLMPDAEVSHVVEEIVARFPGDAFLMRSVSGQYAALGREAEALEYARRALALSPASLELQTNLANLYFRFHHWEAAASLYESFVRATGRRHCGRLINLAQALAALNDPRAEELLAEAAALAQTAQEYLALGDAYAACGNKEAALAAFRRSLSYTPLPTACRRRAEDALRQLATE